RPASAHSWAISRDADGSFSDGLRMNVLPEAMAMGNIHIGTMAGKLNGGMPATTPTGCRIEYEATPGEAVSGNPPLGRGGRPRANWAAPRAAAHLAGRVRGHLAMLGGDERGQLGGVLPDQLPELEQHRGPFGQGD